MYRVVSRSPSVGVAPQRLVTIDGCDELAERCIALCGSFGELIQQDRSCYKLRNNDVVAGGQVYFEPPQPRSRERQG